MKDSVLAVFYGVIMGISNVVPGVSGGTMAIIFGFYDRLISVLTLNIQAIKDNFKFMALLAVGIVIGIVGFAKVMNYLMMTFEHPTYMAFVGVILGSLPMIVKKAEIRKITPSVVIPFLITFGLMILLSLFGDENTAQINIVQLNVFLIIAIFSSSAIATVTMLLPGISGSLLLLVLGMYQGVYGYAIGEFVFPHIIIVGLGMLTGLIVGAKWVDYFLTHHKEAMYAGIIGLLVGSLIQLFPGFDGPWVSLLIFLITLSGMYTFNQRNGDKS